MISGEMCDINSWQTVSCSRRTMLHGIS